MQCVCVRACACACVCTGEGAHAARGLDAPQLELAVGGGGHEPRAVQELDVGHRLAVVLEHGQRRTRRPQVVVVHAVVRGPERQVARRPAHGRGGVKQVPNMSGVRPRTLSQKCMKHLINCRCVNIFVFNL